MKTIKNLEIELNNNIVLEKKLKDILYRTKKNIIILKRISNRNKKDNILYKQFLEEKKIVIKKIRDSNKKICTLKNNIRYIRRKTAKKSFPKRNKFMNRMNRNNKDMINESKYNKFVKDRKKYCKNNKIKNKTKFNRRGERNRHQLDNNKIYEIKKNKYRSIGGFIKNIKKVLINILKNINDECFVYDSDLNFVDITYIISKSISNNWSTSIVNQHIKDKNIAYVSNSAINDKRKKIDYRYFKLIYNTLMDIIKKDIEYYSNKINIKNLYAVDGSKINFFKHLENDGYTISENNHYCKALISAIYDVSNELVADIVVDKSMNEGKIFETQLNKCDGHYFTKGVLDKMNVKEINGIFKVPRNICICKDFLKTNKQSRIYNYKGNRVRLIKYKNQNSTYILGTNIFDKKEYSNNFIIKMYEQRWFVEEFFKISKCYLNFNKTHSRSINNILQEVYTQSIIVALSKYIEIVAPVFLTNRHDYNNYKINRKNVINSISNDIMYYILYKKVNKKNIQIIINMLFDLINSVTLIEDNRYEKRIRKLPITQFINNNNYDNG
jgi:hypothetical protein